MIFKKAKKPHTGGQLSHYDLKNFVPSELLIFLPLTNKDAKK